MMQTIKSIWNGKMQFSVQEPGGLVKTDANEQFGGENKGVSPKSLMLISLAGCTGIDVVSVLKKARAEVAKFEIEVTGHLTQEHPKYYDKVHVVYKFYDNNLKKDKIKKSVELSVEKYCGVMEMFRRFSKVTTEIQYLSL